MDIGEERKLTRSCGLHARLGGRFRGRGIWTGGVLHGFQEPDVVRT